MRRDDAVRIETVGQTPGGTGGEAGIRTLGTGFSPYNGLANRRLQPLGHLTAARNLSIRHASSCGNTALAQIVPDIVPARSPKLATKRRCDKAQSADTNAAVLCADNHASVLSQK